MLIKNQESRIKNQESRIKNQESRIKNPLLIISKFKLKSSFLTDFFLKRPKIFNCFVFSRSFWRSVLYFFTNFFSLEEK